MSDQRDKILSFGLSELSIGNMPALASLHLRGLSV
jgi:hypothetical protein